MLKNLTSPNTPHRWPVGTQEKFRPYKEDGRYHANVNNLGELDTFEHHQTAATELNGLLDQFEKVRAAVISLEGSDLDKNRRADVTAVEGLQLDGKQIDAVAAGRRKRADDFSLVRTEARVVDGNGQLLMEENDHLHAKYYDFITPTRNYRVEDQREKDYVSVTLKRA